MAEAKRPYRMRARSAAAAATHRRILDATIELLSERFLDDITLQAVAERSGVTVQTVIRRFGSRQLLLKAAGEDSRRRIMAQRGEAPIGDIDGAVRNLVDHYEQWGDGVLMGLAQERRNPAVRAATSYGRAYHHKWVERVFAPALEQRNGRARERLLAQLVTLCDIYTWKILRRDRKLSRAETELAMAEMLRAVAGANEALG